MALCISLCSCSAKWTDEDITKSTKIEITKYESDNPNIKVIYTITDEDTVNSFCDTFSNLEVKDTHIKKEIGKSYYVRFLGNGGEIDHITVIKGHNTLQDKHGDLYKIISEIDVEDYKNGSLYLFVTRDQFLDWNLENKGDYIFYLASRSAYEGFVTEAPTDEIEDSVTGFAYEKFKFSNNEGNVAKSDAEVVSLMNALIDQWKYTYDSIEITLYTHVPEEELEALNYSGIMQLKYPDRTVIQVKYVNINMEALKELSKRSDISYIHISAPLTAIEDEPAVDG